MNAPAEPAVARMFAVSLTNRVPTSPSSPTQEDAKGVSRSSMPEVREACLRVGFRSSVVKVADVSTCFWEIWLLALFCVISPYPPPIPIPIYPLSKDVKKETKRKKLEKGGRANSRPPQRNSAKTS